MKCVHRAVEQRRLADQPLFVVGKPLPLSLGAYEIARGTLPLPDGFRASQATITVLDRPDGRQLGMRVLYVK